ncbi:MAG: RES family NAD+ phosphorylase, partial [Mycobacterium sp.]
WWCRVYHQGKYVPDGVSFRRYGPLARFDHHHSADPPVVDTTGRRVLYVGEDLATSACEVFGDAGVAAICPFYRVAIVAPTTSLAVYDLAAKGAAMAIGGLPALGDGDEPRWLTQAWARAIYEDQPAGPEIAGIHYRSGYNSGEAMALWDCDADVEVVRDDAGQPQDIALEDPRILIRLQGELRWRQISVTTVSSADCVECQKEALDSDV